MIEGLSHITFLTRDLERMTRFLTEVFEAEQVYDSGDRQFSLSRERFFRIGGLWIAVMEGEDTRVRNYEHVAFKIPDAEIEIYRARLDAAGVEILPGRSRVQGEGRSLYFYDFDNHLFELHSGTLEQRLSRYAKTGSATAD